MNHHDLLGALDGTNPPLPVDGNRPASGTGDHAGDPEHRECSRKGCKNGADWSLEWNNPRIHTSERRKSWLACQEHRDWLADYLRSRGLLKDIRSLAWIPDGDQDGPQDGATESGTATDTAMDTATENDS